MSPMKNSSSLLEPVYPITKPQPRGVMVPDYEKNTLKQHSHFHRAINHIVVVNDNHSLYNHNNCATCEKE